ncbi:hypothetical protein [Costertonia aggregata]|uniref:Uncharacterized protein n=1 Tax=Costertonia aggregata TaxID=343403 RepID=A0A7H9AMV4_9FLAO|nr:hypothetical protein [Costertonia aggregata]QLG44747.1 hypothetical protein HYG79_05085 [Costertonia aggregata]
MLLKVKWEDFKSEVDEYISDGKSLMDKYKTSRTEDELNELKDAKLTWENSVINFVKTSFEPENINFAYDFKEHRGYNTGFKLNVAQLTKNTIQALKGEVDGLKSYLKMLSIADAVISPDGVDLEERGNFDTEAKLNLILSKLYELYPDGKYYSIKWILEGNGIGLDTYNEDFDFAKMLEIRGYVDVMAAKNTNAKLTLEGKLNIEQARKAKVTDYSKISDSEEELKTLIAKVLKEVNKLGIGQQIIFDEFDELRNDIPNLDKKSFGQLLKAKLYDLVTAKAFDKAIASDVFKQFTDQVLSF